MRTCLITAAFAAALALACARTGGKAVTADGEPIAPKTTQETAPGVGAPLPPFDPAKPVALLPPRLGWDAPLMHALEARRSTRSFAPDPLDQRTLSDLLWAATGVNRAAAGQRTAPTARDRRDLDVYAATAGGLYRYAPESHALLPISSEDVRAATGVQELAAIAPLGLVYVSDLSKIAGDAREDQLLFAGAHAGFVSQNVYLYCAAAGLATVVRAYVDKPSLAATMGLGPDQMIVLAQTVGHPGPAAPEGGH